MRSVLSVYIKTHQDSLINSNANYILKIFARMDAKVTKHLFYKFAKNAKIL
jgi:hypothetical protein